MALIHQCYFRAEQRDRLFDYPPYQGFGLEPGVNARLFESCPELESADVRMQLAEYASLLWHWRNVEDPDSWIGFTSYRQRDKSPVIFTDKSAIERGLEKHPVACWLEYQMCDLRRRPISLARHTEICHPGLNEYLASLLEVHGYALPEEWSQASRGFFANYWLMTRRLFENYMQFSWPIVQQALGDVRQSQFYWAESAARTVNNERAVGYLMERLFIIWYMRSGIEPVAVGAAQLFPHRC